MLSYLTSTLDEALAMCLVPRTLGTVPCSLLSMIAASMDPSKNMLFDRIVDSHLCSQIRVHKFS